MKSKFLDKLIEHMDHIDPESLQTQFLRLAREKGLLDAIFEAIQEGVVVLDGKACLTYANRTAERLLGFQMDEVQGEPISRYLRDVEWEGILNLTEGEWSKLVRSEIEVDYPEPRILSFYIVPLASVGSAENGAVIILRDITSDRQRAENRVESERTNALKLLASGVAHEIGNPLNALTIHLQLLERELGGLPDEKQESLRQLVDVALSEVTRLDGIITQFLHAVRPTRPRRVLTQIETTLQETLTLMKHDIENREIVVEIERPQTLPPIRIDGDQIKQAFFNLTKNAIQAMPDGGRLTISVISSDRGIAVSFQDSGVGIDAGRFGRIFDPYHTTKSEGSGLGLMIVQRIIEDHDGQLEVTSEENVGTTFTIFLPFSDRRMRVLKTPVPVAQEVE
ncbi:MAG: ATP-binding protein [Verrucomicrobia bacterium]|nr:ATP-binding protein [Verrucomicrobiota bacterium]MDA1087746.1 ATP-binding protein [Verrucomicrobiota bacterium]